MAMAYFMSINQRFHSRNLRVFNPIHLSELSRSNYTTTTRPSHQAYEAPPKIDSQSLPRTMPSFPLMPLTLATYNQPTTESGIDEWLTGFLRDHHQIYSPDTSITSADSTQDLPAGYPPSSPVQQAHTQVSSSDSQNAQYTDDEDESSDEWHIRAPPPSPAESGRKEGSENCRRRRHDRK